MVRDGIGRDGGIPGCDPDPVDRGRTRALPALPDAAIIGAAMLEKPQGGSAAGELPPAGVARCVVLRGFPLPVLRRADADEGAQEALTGVFRGSARATACILRRPRRRNVSDTGDSQDRHGRHPAELPTFARGRAKEHAGARVVPLAPRTHTDRPEDRSLPLVSHGERRIRVTHKIGTDVTRTECQPSRGRARRDTRGRVWSPWFTCGNPRRGSVCGRWDR